MVKQSHLEHYECSELVSVVSVNSHGCSEAIPGNLEEIAERRALVLAEQPVAAGSRIHVACKSHVLRGTATACRWDQVLGYFIEVRLAPASRWTRKWFTPQHLVNLQQDHLRLSA